MFSFGRRLAVLRTKPWVAKWIAIKTDQNRKPRMKSLWPPWLKWQCNWEPCFRAFWPANADVNYHGFSVPENGGVKWWPELRLLSQETYFLVGEKRWAEMLLGWQATGRQDFSTPFFIPLGFQSWGIIQLSSLNNKIQKHIGKWPWSTYFSLSSPRSPLYYEFL